MTRPERTEPERHDDEVEALLSAGGDIAGEDESGDVEIEGPNPA